MNDTFLKIADFKSKHILAPCGQLIRDLLHKSQRDWNLSEYPWYSDLFMHTEELYSEDFYNDPSVDPIYRSPIQFWIVSDWFGKQLKSRNQLITNHWGFYIWGRETCNIAICDDDTFLQIYHSHSAPVFTPTNDR